MKIIKILGTGCKKCKSLEIILKEFVKKNNVDADVEKVTDINKMLEYGIMMTPALVIDEEVKSTGIIPNEEQMFKWIINE